MIESLLQDVRDGLRALRREPAFVCTALLSLALGIGANTAIFTVTKAVFGNALPVRDVSRLMEIYWVDNATARTAGAARLNVAYLNYRDLRDRNDAFSSVACFLVQDVTLSGRSDSRPRRIPVTVASANYFDTLGLQPVRGRFLQPGDDLHPGGDRVVVLSHLAWASVFDARPDVLGQTMTLNGVPYTVIGVAPPGFKGTETLSDPGQVWVPVSMLGDVWGAETNPLTIRRSRQFRVFGRLKPDVDAARALAAVKIVGDNLAREFPWENSKSTFDAAPLADAALDSMPSGNGLRIATALSAVVVLILLIACLNVANLLVVRATARSREVAVRAAIGASPARLVRQFVVESALLSAGGGVLGLVVGIAGARLLWSFRPEYLTRSGLALHIDWRVLLFTGGAALATNLIFGLGPALFAASPNLAQLMNTGRRGGSGAGRRSPVRNVLVGLQVAVAFVGLVAAGLLVRSLQHAQRVDLGFDGAHVGVFRFDTNARRYPPEQARGFARAVVDAVAAVPGVTSAALATNPPMNGSGRRTVLSEEQQGDPEVLGTATALNYVSHDFFRTMGMRAREGRLFDAFDRAGGRRVAVVNEAMAKYFWPERSAIGKRFLLRSIPGVHHEVVGVVSNVVLWELDEPPQPIGYIPLDQDPKPYLALHIRADGDPARVLPAAMAKVQALDPDLALVEPLTVDQMVETRLWAWRAGASLFGLFAVMGVILASVGIFGAMSHTIAQRTNEIGIRIALGASTARMQLSMLRDGMIVVLAGIAAGVAAALGLTTFIRGLVFGITTSDPATFASTTWIFAGVAAFACWLAGRRILRIDPIRAINQG